MGQPKSNNNYYHADSTSSLNNRMLFEHFTVAMHPFLIFSYQQSLVNLIEKHFCIAESGATLSRERKSGAAQAAPASPTPTAMPCMLVQLKSSLLRQLAIDHA